MQHRDCRDLEVGMFPMKQPSDTRAKLLVSYDIVPETQQAYYEFVMRVFLPKLQEMGLAMTEAWHTIYGAYPVRLAAFVAPDRETMDRVLNSPEYRELEEHLKRFVRNLGYKIVGYKDGFQF